MVGIRLFKNRTFTQRLGVFINQEIDSASDPEVGSKLRFTYPLKKATLPLYPLKGPKARLQELLTGAGSGNFAGNLAWFASGSRHTVRSASWHPGAAPTCEDVLTTYGPKQKAQDLSLHFVEKDVF